MLICSINYGAGILTINEWQWRLTRLILGVVDLSCEEILGRLRLYLRLEKSKFHRNVQNYLVAWQGRCNDISPKCLKAGVTFKVSSQLFWIEEMSSYGRWWISIILYPGEWWQIGCWVYWWQADWKMLDIKGIYQYGMDAVGWYFWMRDQAYNNCWLIYSGCLCLSHLFFPDF